MRALRKNQDAYGGAMLDYFEGRRATPPIIERDDGLLEPDYSGDLYFSPPAKWDRVEREAMRLARGRVLDVGAGPGRHSLYLQDRGHDVVALDSSPLMIELCKRRGVKNTKLMPLAAIGSNLGTFDSVIMPGNNFGLFGSPRRAGILLKRLHKMTPRDARVIGQTLDPYETDDPNHLAYHRLNRKRGRLPGQVRIRVRYKKLATPWFDYLFVSRKEMTTIADGTGWHLARTIDTDGPIYVAVLEKD